MFISLRSRLMAVYFGLILFGFGGLTVWAGLQLANAAYADYGQNLQVVALQLASQLVDPLEHSSTAVERLMATTAANIGGQVALFDSSQRLLLTTDGKPATLRAVNSYRYETNENGARTVYTAVPVIYEEQPLGIVQLGVPASAPAAIVRQRISALAGGFLLISGLGMGISLWLVATMTRPLSTLRDSALTMARGNLGERVEPIGRDEIGEVAAAFNEMAQRVEAMVHEQRAFASNASHELRTPLTTIKLRTEALQQEIDDPQLVADYVGEIEAEIDRMARLVDDLLLLSRLDAHRLQAGTEAIDARRVLQVVQRDYAPRAGAKAIALEVAIAPELAPVLAHANHLRVVFGNIIGNAIKYTATGGRVQATLQQRTDQLLFQVEDTGVGIAAGDLPNIGKRFFRADKAHSRTTAGSGLGLALVGSIVALYQGELRIESAGVGQGTTVTVLWPLAAAQSDLL